MMWGLGKHSSRQLKLHFTYFILSKFASLGLLASLLSVGECARITLPLRLYSGCASMGVDAN